MTFSSSLVCDSASEYFASEDPKLFWRFVECLLGEGLQENLSRLTESQQHDLVLGCARNILPGGATEMLKFALATRYYSPALEAYASYLKNGVKPAYGRGMLPYMLLRESLGLRLQEYG